MAPPAAPAAAPEGALLRGGGSRVAWRMASALERLVENVILRLAADRGGTCGLALASRLPLPAQVSLTAAAELSRRGVLAVEERDGIRWYRADGQPAPQDCCPGCGGKGGPLLCRACLAPALPDIKREAEKAGGMDRVVAEHQLLAALAGSRGAPAGLAPLAAATSLTAQETEALLTALAAAGSVAIHPDPASVAWTAPAPGIAAEWLTQHRQVLTRAFEPPPPAGFRRVGYEVRRRPVLTAVVMLLSVALVLGVEGMHLRSLRKGAANGYWDLLFMVHKHEKLLARYVERVPGLNAAQVKADLASMAELDLVVRLRRVQQVHRMVRAAHAEGQHPDSEEVLTALADFERAFAAQRTGYDEKARRYGDALHGPLARVVGTVWHFRAAYSPIPEDAWRP